MTEPMTAEYAKSGKAGCKGCSENIAKGKLRLGFVGKANFGATAWYHYDCIWNDVGNLKAVDSSKAIASLVKGIESLDDSDQDKIAKDLPTYCKEAAKKAAEAPKVTSTEPIAVEYAKSAKSTCKGCGDIIAKDAMRVGFTKKANFGATAWYHYDCFWKEKNHLNEIDWSKPIEKLVGGLDSLRTNGREKLEKDLQKYMKTQSDDGKAALKRKSTDSSSSPSKKKK